MQIGCNMVSVAFTKLHRSILTSSVWMKDDATRLVWITLLALCDRDGVARVSSDALAYTARVSQEDCDKSLKILQEPEERSRTKDFEGRRIRETNGGYEVLNYDRYVHEGVRQQRREYMAQKQREYRARKNAKGKTIRPEHVDQPK